VIVAYLYKSETGRRRILEDRNTGNCLRCCGTVRLFRMATANIRPRRDIRRHTHRPCTLPDIHSGVRPESLCTKNRDRKRSADYIRLRPHTVYGKKKLIQDMVNRFQLLSQSYFFQNNRLSFENQYRIKYVN